MGRPRGSKNSKGSNKRKEKVKCPSVSDARKTKSMDELLGGGKLELQSVDSSEEEGELLSPKSSLVTLQKQSEEKQLFS